MRWPGRHNPDPTACGRTCGQPLHPNPCLECRRVAPAKHRQDYGEGFRSPISGRRLSRWSSGPSHSPLAASAPRSVWVPGKDGQKSPRLVDFSLPAWAGVRTCCGCLSHTELTWGKEGLGTAGGDSMAAGLAAGLGIGASVRGRRVGAAKSLLVVS